MKHFIVECKDKNGKRYDVVVLAANAQDAGTQALQQGHEVLFVENRD